MKASEIEPRKLVVFDIDDTLVHTQTKVHVIKDGEVVDSLNSHDFTHYRLKPGEDFDFSGFRNAREFFEKSRPIIPMMNQLKRDIATGNKVVMVTARADFDDKELFLDTFRKFGIDMGKVHVYRAGNSKEGTTEERKKAIIKSLLDKGDYTKAIMYDDAKPNLHTFMELKQDHPRTKFYAWHVSLEGEASEYMREGFYENFWDDDEEDGEHMRLTDLLSYPEIVNRISSMMRAMGWRGKRKSDDDYVFMTRGQLEDEWYTVTIGKAAGGKGFTYALGTIEEEDPHIGQQETMPNTVASVSMLADEIRDGFGMNENATVKSKTFYHATYRPLLKSIMSQGLGGSAAQAKWEDSQPGVTYLARDPEVARSYAETSDMVPEEWLDDIVILAIDASRLDSRKLRRDRNVQDDDSTLEYHGVIKDFTLTENFADGQVKGKSRPGRVKRAGASCNGSVTDLRKRAKNASGERAKMLHWCANMKSGRNK